MKRLLLLVAACSHAAPLATQPVYTAETVHVPGADRPRFFVWETAELGDALYAFTDTGVTIIRGGIAVATGLEPPRAGLGRADRLTHAEWHAAVIPALDGEGRWVVAVRDGALYRVTLAGEFDPIGERFGIHGEPVDDVQSSGTTIAIQLRTALLVSTGGVRIDRYPVHGQLAIARDHLALRRDGHVELWDLVARRRTTFAIDGTPVFEDPDNRPRLVIATRNRVWVERDGSLEPLALPAATSELANEGDIYVAGAKLWLQRDFKLFLLNGRQFAVVTPQPPSGLVFSTRSGDVWIERPTGELRRISTTPSNGDPAWQAQVAPVFQRVCSHCHLPGGEAGIDLSTPASWASDRDEITRRVLVTRTMPPAGTDLSDSDRAALEHWLAAK